MDVAVAIGLTGRSLTRALSATGRGVVLVATAALSLALFITTALATAFILLGVGVLLLPLVTPLVRRLTGLCRNVAARSGVPIAAPYLPLPPLEPGMFGWVQRCRAILTDPATWRDLLFLLLNTLVGFALGLLPLTLLVYSVEGLLLSTGFWMLMRESGVNFWYGFTALDSWPHAALGALVSLAVFGIWAATAPHVIAGHAYFARSLLGPSERSVIASRMRHLSETRSDVINIQATELRRIERDLHDGAQARLVAIGMKLGAASRQLRTNPDAAETLLVDARNATATALEELRCLIRGIHPPVLAERGLEDAIRAIALESPIEVEVTTDVPGRMAAPTESAVYFALSELLNNVVKHANADRASIDLRHTDGLLRAVVIDNGQGGADASLGTGLRGIERRCATFDGTLVLSSPEGGPTVAILELPCALFSPRTSSF
ncbi:sensor domain-containing protein [Micromonospora sp. WMMD987]|jgi:signal transduction histidine kinase|uniref:sensor histidine kinase n=1 Tax=Micromonospora TaxID=1873 RepID=UPI00249C1BBF|nr:sensor domain-containing protein [Micromonospora sp. WMMD987]WFE97241.1 sensor domain-containing protein [Micromonospora sp. WMMD987]